VNLYELTKKPWTLLAAGFEDLRNPPPGNKPCLDVLRSLAISLVIAYHVRTFAPHAFLTLKMPFSRFGWTGVDLFFVLSGFLIGGQLWKELKASGSVDVGRFILRRGFRIWPFYYFLVALILVQQIFFGRPSHGLWLDATFLSNYYHLFPIGGHQIGNGWSLSLEEQFYLLIPILLAIGAKFVPPKLLVDLVLVWLLALPLIRHFALRGLHDPWEIQTAIYYQFQTHSDGLAVGLLIAWILVWKPEVLQMSRWLDAALVLVFLGGFCLWYVASPTFLFSVVALAYGALTLLLLRVRWTFLFRARVFYVISRLSYGVYLLHSEVMVRVMAYHQRIFGEGFRSFFLAFVLWGGVSMALAFVTFSFIELPFLKLRDRLLARNLKIGPASERAFAVSQTRAS